MKILNLLFFLPALFSTLQIYSAIPMEFGKHDGGEYCYRIPGSRSGRMFPEQMYKHDVGGVDDDPADLAPVQKQNLSIVEFRNLFPAFKIYVHDHPLVYFDSAATAQMPQMVLDEMIDYYQNYKSNVGRGLYAFAEHATKKFEQSRRKVANFINAKKEEIIFTQGSTAGINLVAQMWAQHHLQAGDEIIVSELEHNANFIPWQQLAKDRGLILTRVPLSAQGIVDPQALQTYLSGKTKLVAITHQSNILGTSNDVAAIARAVHAVGAKVLVDGAQSIAHHKIDVRDLDCDLFVFSGHKLFGPTGVGVLFVKRELFDACKLVNFGGGAVYSVTPEHTDFKMPPHCFEPGTQAIAEVIGLGAAIDFVQKYIDFEKIAEHETALVCKLARALQNMPGITLLSPIPLAGQHNNLVTFTVQNLHAYDVACFLDEYGIAVRA